MNKIAANCRKESNAKFYYASRKMAFESKAIKLMAYFISIIPIVLSLIPMGDKKTLVFAATMVSFSLSIILEFLSTFLNTHKEQSVLLNQLYEAGITGSTFSKIEYDREMTNSLNELAIRKAEPRISSSKEFHIVNVPKEVDEKYSYFYICRMNAASHNYLMSRMYAVYILVLILIIGLFTSFAFVKHDTFEFLQLIIQFYPLILPIIRNINACQKAMRYYTKVSADIDNYFADGNKSAEKRACFVYYIQNLEFEAMMATPARYAIFFRMFRGGLKKLRRGVTNRFIDGVEELEGKKRTRLEPVPLKTSKRKKEREETKLLQEEEIKVQKTVSSNKTKKEVKNKTDEKPKQTEKKSAPRKAKVTTKEEPLSKTKKETKTVSKAIATKAKETANKETVKKTSQTKAVKAKK